MTAWIDAITGFIGAHPHWAGLVVFLVAASEAVVLVGFVIPGTAILLAVGGVIGLGHLPLVPILLWAAAGAIAGDGFSFWLGHTYQDGLRRRWPFSRYPDLVDRAESFFHRHGGKSVFLGRFVPVLKPIVPVVAGTLGMRPARFYVANVVSAVLWSPAHILPGVLVGMSLGLLHGVSARLVVVAVAAVVAVVLLVWSVHLAVRRIGPALGRAHRLAFEWASNRPGTLADRLVRTFDPDHPGTPALLLALAVLVAATLGFAWVLEDVVTGDPLVQADRAISNFMTSLRNPWVDPIMVVVTSLGDAVVTAPVALALFGWLVARRAWRLAGAAALAIGLTGLAVPALKALLRVPRPETLYTGVDAYAFPSGHTTMAAVLYGLAAWLVAGGLGPRARGVAYALSLGMVVAIAVSRVYLEAHWPSDVMAGFFLGTAAAATVAVLFRHAGRERLRAAALAVVLIATLAVAGAWHVGRSFDAQMARYAPRHVLVTTTASDWRSARWRELPARRIDLVGEFEEPLSVQWLGSPAALESRLLAAGWERPPVWSIATAVGFFKPGAELAALPALPTLHDGRKPVVLLVKPDGAANTRWAFRAWPTDLEAARPGSSPRPLLVGSVVLERETHPGGMLSMVRANRQGGPSLSDLLGQLDGVWEERFRSGGTVLLGSEADPAAIRWRQSFVATARREARRRSRPEERPRTRPDEAGSALRAPC